MLGLSFKMCFAQLPVALQFEEFYWKAWEEPLAKDLKMIEIYKLRDIPRMDQILETRFWSVDNFHVIDYDQNGKEDLIYFGFAGEDCDKTIFLNGDCNSYQIEFEYYGEIINIWQYKPLEQICFKILDRPGCDGTTAQVETYEPNWNQEELRYQLVSKEAFIEWTEFPIEFVSAQSFIVKNNFYRLRSTAQIDDEPNFDHFAYCSEGNIIAEYPKNSIGIMLNRKIIDSMEWWFVLMNSNDKVENSIFHQGRNGKDDAAYYGWMSSKYLEVLSK